MAVTSTFPEIAAARMNLRRIPIDEQSGRVRGLRRRSPRLRRRRTTCGSAEVSRPPAPDSVAMTSRRNEPDANHHDEYGGSEQRASKHNLAHDHAHLTQARDRSRQETSAGGPIPLALLRRRFMTGRPESARLRSAAIPTRLTPNRDST